MANQSEQDDMDRLLDKINTSSFKESTISSFYKDKSIFITGASGLMGKVLVEKLLRSCSDVKNIYILLRTKKNVDPYARLEELIQSKVFSRIREIDANLLKKVIVIPGDMIVPNLGISESNIELLCREVSIVFHSAATVKFDEPMRTSINFNALSTRHMLQLCRKMKKLQAFIHVSTAYSNCDRQDVEEQFYPLNVPYKKIIELNEWMDDDTLNALTPYLLGNRPNTYTYTKALAETLLLNEKGSLPIAIVRPSIVTASWREPFPGWVDNINGATGMVLAAGKGLLRTMLHDSKACADIIPVDMVINLMITVAWYTATRTPEHIAIYNCTSGTLNQLKWSDMKRLVFRFVMKYPSATILRYPGGTFKELKAYNEFCNIINHLVPAYIFDAIRFLCWKKPILVRIYQKLNRAIQSLEYFTTRNWNFYSTNVIALSEQLQGIDQKLFNFDVRNLNWDEYWEDYVLGIRKFILKEDDSTITDSRKNLKRMYYIQNIIYAFITLIISYVLFTNTSSSSQSSSLSLISSTSPSSLSSWILSIMKIIWPTEPTTFNDNNNQINQTLRLSSSSSSSMSTITTLQNFTSIISLNSHQSSIWTLVASYMGLPISSITT